MRAEKLIDVVFDAPPGPESGRFVETEDMGGRSIRVGEWVQRTDGFWALRLAAMIETDRGPALAESGIPD